MEVWAKRDKPTSSTIWRLFLSTLPFFYGVIGHRCLWSIPRFSRNGFKGRNSPPQSVCNAIIFVSNWVSTNCLNLLNTMKVSCLAWSKYNQVNWEWSLIKRHKYFIPVIEAMGEGPQRSECTKFEGLEAQELSLQKVIYGS